MQNRLQLIKFPFFDNDDSPGMGQGDLTKDGILDELNLEGIDESGNDDEPSGLEKDKKESVKPKEEGTKKTEETGDDEEKTLEDEIEEDLELDEPQEVDEELELEVPVRRKEILAKYPNLFKDFPYLAKAYFKEGQYSEILPTVEDARVAVEKSELLDKYGQELAKGDSRSILKDTREANPEAFKELVDNYLPALYEVDNNAYYHVVGNISKDIIKHMVDTSKSQGDKSLFEAAKVLNKFLFNSDKYEPPTKLGKLADKSDKEKEFEEERTRYYQERASETIQELETKTKNIVKSIVDKNIDPKESMDSYVRRNATRDVMDLLEDTMDNDPRFTAVVKKMMVRAGEQNFNNESLNRIRAAYLAKAKSLLPDIIKKVRREALGRGSKSADNSNKGPLPVGRTRTATPHSSGKSDSEKAKTIPRGMSSFEFLNSD